jgi:hypothetical protein
VKQGRRKMIKAIGVYLAQVVLALTGNPALAASLKLLPKAARFPCRIVVEDSGSHLELLASPTEWDRWAAEFRRSGPPRPNNPQSKAAYVPMVILGQVSVKMFFSAVLIDESIPGKLRNTLGAGNLLPQLGF